MKRDEKGFVKIDEEGLRQRFGRQGLVRAMLPKKVEAAITHLEEILDDALINNEGVSGLGTAEEIKDWYERGKLDKLNEWVAEEEGVAIEELRNGFYSLVNAFFD